MVKAEEKQLEAIIRDFLAQYEGSLLGLMDALDGATISHYSSGCNNKRVTFELFPASGYVRQLLEMLTLDRLPRSKSSDLKDASRYNQQNPGADFLRYLRRWGGFAEQVMRTEGDSARGIAAARAKLIIDELSLRLNEARQGSRQPAFVQLMRAIGTTLEARQKRSEEQQVSTNKQQTENNYLRALAAAQNKSKVRFRKSALTASAA